LARWSEAGPGAAQQRHGAVVLVAEVGGGRAMMRHHSVKVVIAAHRRGRRCRSSTWPALKRHGIGVEAARPAERRSSAEMRRCAELRMVVWRC
jgi:hypothetical protein